MENKAYKIKGNKQLIVGYIEKIWNEMNFTQLNDFVAPNFIDHSLPPNLPANTEGLKLWIEGTSKSFSHKSIIEEHVTEGNKSIIKFRMLLKHIGTWRGIEPTGAEIATIGYRCFKIDACKIVEHWALLDGNSIENQLRESSQGCKIQE